MAAETSQSPEPRRRWSQFSLLAIFVLTAIAAVISAAATGVFGAFAARVTCGCLLYLAAFFAYVILALGLVFTSRVVISTRGDPRKAPLKDERSAPHS